MDPLIPVVGLMASTMMEFVSLWQIEIATGWADDTFEFPFFAFVVNKWWARDFFYAVNILGWIIGIVSGYLLLVN
jgi:hypothetical protein